MTYLSLNHLLQGAEVDPKKIALIIGETTFTYADLDSLSDKLAVALIKRGINVGDRVAFLLPNCLEIVLCYYACLKIGAIAVPLNIRFKSEMLQYVINDSEADILICDGDLFVEIAKIRNQLKTVKHIYLTQGKNNFSGVYDFNDLLTTKKSTVLPILSSETPAVIFYTSGTTGYPKGVIHTHYSLQQAMISQTKQININQNDITLVMFPLCYLIGFGSQLLTYHACGATCVLLPYFEPKSALESMHRYKITKIYGFPGLYNELINYPKAADYQLKTLNFCLSGGEAIPVALQKRFKKLFGVEITEGCGMTELQFYAMNHPYQAKKVGSIGKPIVDVKINLIDVHGEKIS